MQAAEHGTVRQLESMVRGLRTVRDASDHAADGADEYVSHSWTADSQWRLCARLDPERGAVVEAALSAVARAEELCAADALVRLAEIGLAALGDGAAAPRALRGEERAAVVVHLDAARVPAEPVAGTEVDAPRPRERSRPYARIADGPGLPNQIVERLLCSGRIRTVLRDGRGGRSNVLELGRSHRVVTERQFRALMLRDGGCKHPGCDARRGVEAHHVRHWLYGGRTDLANLILLCKRHHHAHHDDEFSIVPLGRGWFRFLRRDDVELPDRIDPCALVGTTVPIEAEHSDVRSDAATPRWDGTRLDRDWAVVALAQHLVRTDDPAAGSREPSDHGGPPPTAKAHIDIA